MAGETAVVVDATAVAERVGAALGTDVGTLRVLDVYHRALRGLGKDVAFVKVENRATGEKLDLCLAEDGTVEAADVVLQADLEAKRAAESKIHPALSAKLARAEGRDDRSPVIVWLQVEDKLPDPPMDDKAEPEGQGAEPAAQREVKAKVALQTRAVRRSSLRKVMNKATQSCAAFLEDRGAGPIRRGLVTPTIVASLSGDEVEALAQREDVVRIVPDVLKKREMKVMLPTVAADAVWPEVDGTGGKIAIVEGDAIAENPHLGAFTSRPGSYSVDGHKTKVAGCARSQDTDHRGAAPGATLYDAASTSMNWSDLKDAADWAIDQGVHVINNSWGSPQNGAWQDDDLYFDWISCYDRVAVVKSGGNEGQDSGYVTSPGCGYNVITVGNVDPEGGSGFRMDPWSSYRDPESGGDKPEVCAPGQAETGASPEWRGLLTSSPWFGDAGFGGTSFAAPIVSGICALIIDKYSGWGNEPEVLKAALMVGGLHRNIEGEARMSEKDGAGMVTAKCIYAGKYATTVSEASFDANEEFEIPSDISLTAGVTKRIVMVYAHQPKVMVETSPDPVADYDRCDLDMRLYVDGTVVATSEYTTRNAFEIISYVPTVTGTGRVRLRKWLWDADVTNLRVGLAWASADTLESVINIDNNDNDGGCCGTGAATGALLTFMALCLIRPRSGRPGGRG